MDDTRTNLAQTVGGSTEAAEQAPPRGRRVSQWEGPNEEFLQMLMNLGISKNAAVKVCENCLRFVHMSCQDLLRREENKIFRSIWIFISLSSLMNFKKESCRTV